MSRLEHMDISGFSSTSGLACVIMLIIVFPNSKEVASIQQQALCLIIPRACKNEQGLWVHGDWLFASEYLFMYVRVLRKLGMDKLIFPLNLVAEGTHLTKIWLLLNHSQEGKHSQEGVCSCIVEGGISNYTCMAGVKDYIVLFFTYLSGGHTGTCI